MTPFQERCCAYILRQPCGWPATVTDMAAALKTSRLAVSSAMRSLESQGLAGSTRTGSDQWAAQVWFLKSTVRTLSAPTDKPEESEWNTK